MARSTLLLPLLFACQQTADPSVEVQYALEYPSGVSENLPHQVAGSTLRLEAVVTQQGRPAKGVKVTWQDGNVFSNLTPVDAVSDESGRARTTWTLPSLPADQFSMLREVRVFVPGARNNPLVYRIEIFRCTRGCEGA